METESEEFDSFLSPCYDRGKILVEDDRKNGGGKSRVGEIIHRPAKDLSFLNWHVEVDDGVTYLSLSDRPDLLPHKNKVANSKTEEGDGDDGNQIRRDNDEAL